MRQTILIRLFSVSLLAAAIAGCGNDAKEQRVPSDVPDSIDVVTEGAGDPPPPAVGLTLPAPTDGVAVLAGTSIPVMLSNPSAQTVSARLSADVQANGAFASVDLGTFDLSPGASLEVPASMRELGIDLDTLETPAGIGFRLLTEDPTGEAIDGLALATWYLHRDGDSVVLYDRDTLIDRYNGGDLTGTFSEPGGVDPFPGAIKIAAGSGGGAPDPNVPPPVLTSGEQTICIHWQYESRGHNAGETYYSKAEPMAAFGVRVAVQSTSGTTSHLANRNNGCLSVPVPDGLFKVIVHAHAVVGNGHDIVVRAFELEDDSLENSNLPDSLERSWVFKAVTGPDPVHIYVPADASSTMMAFGTFSAASLDALVPVTNASPKLDIRLVATRDNSESSTGSIYIAPSQRDIKFLYGHEVGHWYGNNSTFGTGSAYQWSSDDPDCASNDPDPDYHAHDHLLRGTEVHGAAFKEGLAHALSTFVWNGVAASQPRFRYYKDLDDLDAYNDLQADYYRVDMAAKTDDPDTLGGVRAWRSAKCSASDDPHDKVSVELDWARFFVNYVDPSTNALYGPAPTFAQLVQLLQAARAYQGEVNTNAIYVYDIYPILIDEISDETLGQLQYVDRFKTLAEIYDITNP